MAHIKHLRRYRHNPALARAIERNIETEVEIEEMLKAGRGLHDRLADVITAFAGSMAFVYVHAVWFGAWIAWNTLLPGRAFDGYPFGLLTMIVSLEAIFLSTFILISQNRQAELADERSDLDVQIDLLAEYEVTKLLRIATALAEHFKLDVGNDHELRELAREAAPKEILRELKDRKEEGR